MNDNPKWEIIQGVALQLLPNFAPGGVGRIGDDGIIGSGGKIGKQLQGITLDDFPLGKMRL